MSLPVDWDPSMMADDIQTLRCEYQTQVAKSLPSPRLQLPGHISVRIVWEARRAHLSFLPLLELAAEPVLPAMPPVPEMFQMDGQGDESADSLPSLENQVLIL
ncbi:unnamed protein product [Symbiodinium sp. KB8]|nr:unnamed protein product [Symbiodinium sp. KB8]